MYRLKSEEQYMQQTKYGAYRVFVIKSPVSTLRSLFSYSREIGEEIEIDDVIYEPIAYEFKALNTTVKIGELVGVMVKNIN